MTDFEKELLEISEKNSANDIALRREELDFKLATAKEEKNKNTKLSTGQVTLLVAVIGLLGTFIGAIIQGFFSQELERQKFESELILKVMTANDVEQNRTNLKFLLDAGLVKEHEAELRRLSSDTAFDVKIPTSGDVQATESIRGFITDGATNSPIPGARIQAFLGENLLTVTSDDYGMFLFTNVPASYSGTDIKITVDKSGYAPITLSVVIGKDPIKIVLKKL